MTMKGKSYASNGENRRPAMQRKESPTNAHNAAVHLHEVGCRSPAVRVGQQTTRSGQSALQIDVSKAATPVRRAPVFAAELGRERSHEDSSTHGFNNGTRASL